MAIYYATITGDGSGTIRNLPYFGEAFVRFRLTRNDLLRLGEGLHQLGKLLFAASAATHGRFWVAPEGLLRVLLNCFLRFRDFHPSDRWNNWMNCVQLSYERRAASRQFIFSVRVRWVKTGRNVR